MSLVASIFGAIGSAVTGFFGFKKSQADTVESAIRVVGDISASDDARAAAIAQIISSEAKSDSWLTRMWRPMFMTVLAGLVVAHWFGYSPENMNIQDGSLMREIFDLLKIGVMGYIPARTVDKIMQQIQIGKVLRTFIEKRFS